MILAVSAPFQVSAAATDWAKNEKARKMMKCDGCLDRLEKGGAPICVEACPQRAISFGEISELRRTFGTLAVTPPLPDPAQTRPALVIVPAPKAK